MSNLSKYRTSNLEGLEIVNKISEGPMSEIYLAFDKVNLRMCIIKKSKDESCCKIRLIREGKILDKLCYSGIPKAKLVFDVKNVFLILTYIRGETLENYINNKEKMSQSDTLDLALKLCRILVYLHNENPPVCHRDINPSNIMIDEAGKVFLIDFGSAVDFFEKSFVNLGTPEFAAPEQFESANFEPRSDIYSFGTTLKFVLEDEHCSFEEMQRIIEKCMQKSLNKRYRNSNELMGDLLKIYTSRKYH